MEESRKIEQLQGLYRQRLQNLPKIINQLHEIVKGDEILNTLKDPTMEKYRIDRVNELVLEVLNSEKEKMLIRVLEKYQEQSAKLKQKDQKYDHMKSNSNKQNSYYDNWLDLKQSSEKEISKCRLLLDEKNQTIQTINKELKDIKNKLNAAHSRLQEISTGGSKCENCAGCEKLKEDLALSQNQMKVAKLLVEKLKRDGESAVQQLNQKIKIMSEKNQKLQSELLKKPHRAFKQSKQDIDFKNDNAKRNEKVEVMRRQIAYLQQQLVQVQKQFNVVRDVAIGGTATEIKKLQNLHKKLQQFVVQSLRNMGKQTKNISQKITSKLASQMGKNTESLKPEKLMSKLNYIENELDYFIENQILVE